MENKTAIIDDDILTDILGNFKPLECPFCHSPGHVYMKPIWNAQRGFENHYLYFCGCTNPECNIAPQTKPLNDIDMRGVEAVMDSVRAWNNR